LENIINWFWCPDNNSELVVNVELGKGLNVSQRRNPSNVNFKIADKLVVASAAQLFSEFLISPPVLILDFFFQTLEC
jgi:hypothetical protein